MTSNEPRDHCIHSGDLFFVLLLLGGDIVGRALAQIAGKWVAYSVSALVSVIGENKLMPRDLDCKSKIINGKNGYIRENLSWILGRIVRDFSSWNKLATKNMTTDILNKKWKELKKEDPETVKPTIAGLIVTVYQPRETQLGAFPKLYFVYESGKKAISTLANRISRH
ncbi:MAG: hypothetical protein M1834_004262 [Cirrosporium novae-zelandiae]|nr:MAG: hypothetical protein M1834_004262 [Cirrosporium novae-zelandiae]